MHGHRLLIPKKRKVINKLVVVVVLFALHGLEVNEILLLLTSIPLKLLARIVLLVSPPIPAMSMVSYAAGARYLSLIGGACLKFLRLVL